MSHIKGYLQFISEQNQDQTERVLKTKIATYTNLIANAKKSGRKGAEEIFQKRLDEYQKKLDNLLQTRNPTTTSDANKTPVDNNANKTPVDNNANKTPVDNNANKTPVDNNANKTPVDNNAKKTPVDNNAKKSDANKPPVVAKKSDANKPPVVAKKQKRFQIKSSGRGNEALRARNIAKAKARKQNPTVNTKPTLNKAGTDSGSGVDALKQRMIKRSEERGK